MPNNIESSNINLFEIFNTHFTKQNSEKINKTIHLIWIGTKLPLKYVDKLHLLSLSAKLNNYKINVWVDKLINIIQPFEIANFNYKHISIKLVDELSSYITEEFSGERKYIAELVNREMIGAKNYACASDVLRYIIVYKEGGIYTDFDAIASPDKTYMPKITTGEELAIRIAYGRDDKKIKAHKFRMFKAELKEMKSHPIPELEFAHGFSSFTLKSNDKFYSVQNHPILKSLILSIIEHSIPLDREIPLTQYNELTFDYAEIPAGDHRKHIDIGDIYLNIHDFRRCSSTYPDLIRKFGRDKLESIANRFDEVISHGPRKSLVLKFTGPEAFAINIINFFTEKIANDLGIENLDMFDVNDYLVFYLNELFSAHDHCLAVKTNEAGLSWLRFNYTSSYDDSCLIDHKLLYGESELFKDVA